MTTRTVVGTAVGLALGLVVVFASFAEMLLVALFAAIGYVVAKVLEGDIHVTRYTSDRYR